MHTTYILHADNAPISVEVRSYASADVIRLATPNATHWLTLTIGTAEITLHGTNLERIREAVEAIKNAAEASAQADEQFLCK